MKVIFTGANGMLAQAFRDVVKNHEDIEATFMEKFYLNIADYKSVDTFFNNYKFDVLINCAAYTKVDLAETEPEIANQINGYSVGYLASKCKKNNQLFVTFSTDYVFDGTNPKGYKEKAKTNPINAYGHSKQIGEYLLKKESDKFYLIRTQWLYGPYGKNFVDTISTLFNDNKELKIVNDQFGSPTYTLDLAEKTLELIENQKKYKYGTYHITNNGVCTWYDFAKYFLHYANPQSHVNVIPVTSEEFPRPAMRPKYSKLISTKTEPLRSWQEAVEDYINRKNNV